MAPSNPSSNCLVTGAASGIGRHLTGALLARGHRVVAVDLSTERLETACAEDGWNREKLALARLDVRSAEDWERGIELCDARFGPLDWMFNVAGVLQPGYLLDVKDADIDAQIDVNYKGVVIGTRAAARRMVREGRGHIVNFGSLASLAPVPGLSLYSSSKFAVRGFSLAVAQELQPRGVYVTVVLPDAVQTPMLDLQVDYEEAAMTFSGDRPLTVDEIANAIFDVVLPRRPMELAIPFTRGLIARTSNLLPATSRVLGPLIRKRGLAQQSAARQKKS